MRQHIVVARPPNFDQILAVFPRANMNGVFFSYGDKIYNPSNVAITKPLLAHEAKHGERQLDCGVASWWDDYLTKPLFVLDEEIYAHRAEWLASVKRHGPENRRLREIVERLSGQLYNHAISYEQAKHAILTGQVQ